MNESHMDLLSINEEECAMVAHDSPCSEDLDDSIITFGQQSSEKENLRKYTMHISLNMSYNPGRSANETPHIAQYPGEKIICKEQSMWHEEKKRIQVLMKNIKAKSLLRKNLEKMNILTQQMIHKNQI